MIDKIYIRLIYRFDNTDINGRFGIFIDPEIVLEDFGFSIFNTERGSPVGFEDEKIYDILSKLLSQKLQRTIDLNTEVLDLRNFKEE